MINCYATKEDYTKYGTKVLEDTEIDKYLELASIDINRATLTRIEKRGFKNLTSRTKRFNNQSNLLSSRIYKRRRII